MFVSVLMIQHVSVLAWLQWKNLCPKQNLQVVLVPGVFVSVTEKFKAGSFLNVTRSGTVTRFYEQRLDYSWEESQRLLQDSEGNVLGTRVLIS